MCVLHRPWRTYKYGDLKRLRQVTAGSSFGNDNNKSSQHIIMRFFALLLATAPAALAAPSVQPRQANDIVPGRWIVQVRGTSDIESVLAAATDLLRLPRPLEAILQYDINQDYKGFVIGANESLVRVLATLPDVLAYEPDVWMTGADGAPAEDPLKRQAAPGEWAAEPTGTWGTYYSQSPADLSSGEGDFQAAAQQNVFTQSGAEWHLARLSNRPPGSTDYSFHASAGQGSVVYIMDSVCVSQARLHNFC